ncbi:hypothetical protein [Actinophytocola sediminis]
MTRKETAVLLALIATYDQRTVGEADVEAWHAIADVEAWTFARARRAAIEHHRAGADKPRIRPAHITDAINGIRDRVRRAILNANPIAPRGVDPVAWFQQAITDAQRTALDLWANGQPLPNLGDPRAATFLATGPTHLIEATR